MHKTNMVFFFLGGGGVVCFDLFLSVVLACGILGGLLDYGTIHTSRSLLYLNEYPHPSPRGNLLYILNIHFSLIVCVKVT